MSFRPSRSMKASVDHFAVRRARQHGVDQLDHLAVVGQAGQHVLVREPPGQLSRCGRARAPRGGPARAPGRQSRRGRSRSPRAAAAAAAAPPLIERSGSQLEPADDAALARRAPTGPRGRRAGSASKRRSLRPAVRSMPRISRGSSLPEIGAGGADVLDRAEQRAAALQRLPVVGLADQHVADDGAEQRRADHEQRQCRDQAAA